MGNGVRGLGIPSPRDGYHVLRRLEDLRLLPVFLPTGPQMVFSFWSGLPGMAIHDLLAALAGLPPLQVHVMVIAVHWK